MGDADRLVERDRQEGRHRHHRRHAVRNAVTPFGRRIRQRALHDGRAAIVRDAFAANQIEHRLRVEFAQTDIDAGTRGKTS